MTTVEGRPVSLVFEPSSREFNYTYRPDPAISLPTEAKRTYKFIEDNSKDLRDREVTFMRLLPREY
jgi:hypothetical protein